MTNDPFDFSDLEEDFIPVINKSDNSKYARKTYQCEGCGGSGLWNGGKSNRYGNAKCNICHGSGTLVTSPEARAKARAANKNRKREVKAGNMADNISAIGGEARMNALRDAGSWSSFALSIYEAHAYSGKLLSEKQVGAASSMLDKLEANKESKLKSRIDREAASPTVNLQPIRNMFDAVVAKGFKRPKYRAEGFIISLAPAYGANAGALYVKSTDDVYMGKLVGEKFLGTRDSAGSGVDQALQTIAADPLGAAVRYGNATGVCACCGRKLTNYESIARGIGPICAERWGLLDAKWGMDPKAAKAELDEAKARTMG